MTELDWAVVLGGVAAIAWINWYFFLAGSGVPSAETTVELTPAGAGTYDVDRGASVLRGGTTVEDGREG